MKRIVTLLIILTFVGAYNSVRQEKAYGDVAVHIGIGVPIPPPPPIVIPAPPSVIMINKNIVYSFGLAGREPNLVKGGKDGYATLPRGASWKNVRGLSLDWRRGERLRS